MARSLGLGLTCFTLMVAAASATQFQGDWQDGWKEGWKKGWKKGCEECLTVLRAGFEPYNPWAGRLRFRKGNHLQFVYPKETDSVLLVEPVAYNAYSASSYLKKFDDGNTVFTLNRSSPFFFVSGNEASCRANEKLIVVVLADHPRPGALPTMPSPSPSPMPSSLSIKSRAKIIQN